MRKHLYLIVDSPQEEFVGRVASMDRQRPQVEKNVEGVVDKRNMDTGESYQERLVGLGYHDFEDEAEYEEQFVKVVKGKLGEIDEEHLVKAGLDPQEVLA